MSKSFNIDASDVVEMTNKLEKINRSAMPLAVRGTLNEAAFQMKTRYMPKEFEDNFTIRRPNFIKSHTSFNRCKNTFDISEMNSSAGVIKGKDKAGDRLELQERGGNIDERSVPYTYNNGVSPTRIGENEKNKQSSTYFVRKFIKAQKGVIERNKNRTIIKTDKAISVAKKGIGLKTLYLLDRTVSIKKQPFVEPSGIIVNAKIPQYFQIEFQKRLDKIKASNK